MTRVIAPTDFSELSLVGVRAARAHARSLGAPVVVVHSWDRAGMTLYAPYLKTVQAENVAMMNEIDGSIAKRLADVVEACFESGDDVSTAVLHDASAARAIARFAEPDDVIVIATHGRTGLGRALLGSVAEKVVRLARCPVLVVPARGVEG